MTSVATRNLTKRFEGIRAAAERARNRGPKGADFELTLPEAVPEEWAPVVVEIQDILKNINAQMKQLFQLHGARLRVTFAGDKEAQQERQIEILTQEITRQFGTAQNKLSSVASVGNAGDLGRSERIMRYNVMRSFASQLQELSSKFRSAQKEFLIKLDGQKSVGSNFFETKEDGKLSLREVLDREINPDQVRVLEQVDRQQAERHKEIMNLVRSINELSTMFKQLNQLVIDQGTILDRIDYNIVMARDKVKQGNDSLKKAEKESRSPKMLICIILLVVVAIVLLLIVINKFS